MAPRAVKGAMREMRQLKAALAEAGYPPGETAALAAQYHERGRDVFDTFPERSLLFVMPSTTGENTLPLAMAARIRVDRPDIDIVNENDRVAVAIHRGVSKSKGRYDLRVDDHRTFRLIEGPRLQAIRSAVHAGRPLIVVDDVISTGESAVTLAKSLSWAGAKPAALTAALASTTRYATPRDLERLYERLEDHPLGAGYTKDMLRRDIEAFFGPYPNWKINQFARDLGWNAALKRDPALAIRFIRSGAEHLARIKDVITRGIETGPSLPRGPTARRERGGPER